MTGTAPGRLRLFFALWPDPPARRALATLAEGVARDCGGRATPPAALHVTLAFLGSVEADLLPLLEAAAAAVAGASPPFGVTFDRPGGAAGGAIAWLGCRDPAAALPGLQRELRDALAARGVSLEPRAFRPHVTLARGCRRPPARGTAPPPVAWQVRRLALVASRPGPGGSSYRTLRQWTLGVTLNGSPATRRRTPASRRRE